MKCDGVSGKMYVFVDSEGSPIQELSALCVHEKTGEVVDIFHKHIRYPFATDHDIWARCHVHGLNVNYLSAYGLCEEKTVLSMFYTWLNSLSVSCIFGHAPCKEAEFLDISITDVNLPPWAKRCILPSHETAVFMKNNNVPVCGVSCNAHSSFVGWKSKRRILNNTDIAKESHGFHCSLYDCLEIYLYFFDNTCDKK